MNKEINKIISWIEMSYTRLNYKEELSLVDYIKQLQQENQKLKQVIDKAIEYIEDTYYSKNTTDIDSIVLSNNELLKIRKILKEVKWNE